MKAWTFLDIKYVPLLNSKAFSRTLNYANPIPTLIVRTHILLHPFGYFLDVFIDHFPQFIHLPLTI